MTDSRQNILGTTTPTGSVDRCAPPVLPEDGIVDELAIEIAAAGTRRVALTPTERVLAAARVLDAGGTRNDVAERLHVSGTTAAALARRARALHRDGDGDRRAA